MLTIGQLAGYVGVTVRAVRHYHALGLLPEPERTASGYRSYTAQDVIDLRRIKVLTDAGVPLARVRELQGAGPDELDAAVRDLDAQLVRRIEELAATRRSLAELASGGQPFLPPGVASMHEQMRELGVSERTLDCERDAWVLIQVLYPELVEEWAATQAAMLDDPGYADLYRVMDQAWDWPEVDPRIEEVAHRMVEWIRQRDEPDPAGDWDAGSTAYELVTTYRLDASPGWRRMRERVAELMADVMPEARPGATRRP